MFFECSASFVAYSLLSGFNTITEKERDAVRFALELILCYDDLTGKLRMTHDAHILAQIYLAELRIMAARHTYTHDGSLEDPAQARALLSIVILPLVRHISHEEYEQIIHSMEEAESLLSRPLDVLNELITMWKIRNIELVMNWRSFPIPGVESYHFGVKLPVKFRLEEILAPLPYPPKRFPVIRFEKVGYLEGMPETEKSKSEYRHKKLTKCRSKSDDDRDSEVFLRSRCTKKSELLSGTPSKKSKSRSKHFVLPKLVGGGRVTSDSDSDCTRDSWTSDDSYLYIDDVFQKEMQGLAEKGTEAGCLCKAVHTCFIHAEGDPSAYGAQMKAPRGRRIARCLKTVWERL